MPDKEKDNAFILGELKSGINFVISKMEDQEARIRKSEEILYKLADNEEKMIKITDRSEIHEKSIDILLSKITSIEKENKKKDILIKEIEDDTKDNKSIVKIIKWLFGIVITLATAVFTLIIKKFIG